MNDDLITRLRDHAYDVVNGGTNASQLRDDLNAAADEIIESRKETARVTEALTSCTSQIFREASCRTWLGIGEHDDMIEAITNSINRARASARAQTLAEFAEKLAEWVQVELRRPHTGNVHR